MDGRMDGWMVGWVGNRMVELMISYPGKHGEKFICKDFVLVVSRLKGSHVRYWAAAIIPSHVTMSLTH